MMYLGSSSEVLQVPPRHNDAYLLACNPHVPFSLQVSLSLLAEGVCVARGCGVRNEKKQSCGKSGSRNSLQL